MASAADYKVPFRREEVIAAIATDLRFKAQRDRRSHVINVASFLQHSFTSATEVKLQIDIFEPAPDDKRPAYVTYRPLTLHVAKGIWRDGLRGGRVSNYILAHELGHLMLHDHHAQAFSSDGTNHLRAWPKEERAEWQADTFAGHFLVPDIFVSDIGEPRLIALMCDVEEELAQDRVDNFITFGSRYLLSDCGDECPQCGNFTLVRTGTTVTCPCGFQASE